MREGRPGFDRETAANNVMRWIHFSGHVADDVLEALQTRFRFSESVEQRVSAEPNSKPAVEWCEPVQPGDEGVLLVTAHELEFATVLHPTKPKPEQMPSPSSGVDHAMFFETVSDPATLDGNGLEFYVKQISFLCIPSANAVISIHGNPCEVDTFDADFRMLECKTTRLRQAAHWAQLLLSYIDAMVDELHTVLDFYGDALEGLHLAMLQADQPGYSKF